MDFWVSGFVTCGGLWWGSPPELVDPLKVTLQAPIPILELGGLEA